MTTRSTDNGRVLALVIGHLPPPVHGMAVAVDRFADLLQKNARQMGGSCMRLSTAASSRRGSITFHLGRFRRVLAAMWKVWFLRRHRPAVYLSCDAGAGMVYTLALLALARCLALDVWLHHHSYAYLDQPSPKFRILLMIGGMRTTHLVGCPDMANALRSVSRRPLRTTELPILYAVEAPPPESIERPDRESIVLGHLSNLSSDKGLREVFATFHALRQRGVRAELLLAGPAAGPADSKLIDQLIAAAGDGVHYMGPVYGTDREAFFGAIDVFLFPSRYRNESFGLVVGEALLRRVEVVAYARGCLNAELVGTAGLLLSLDGPFTEPATAWIADQSRGSNPSMFQMIEYNRAEAYRHANAVAMEIIRRQQDGRHHPSRLRSAISQRVCLHEWSGARQGRAGQHSHTLPGAPANDRQ